MRYLSLALAIILVSVGTVHAEITPRPSQVDKRFQVVDYSHDIIKLQAAVGRFTEIEFSKDETKIDFLMGDRDAWTIRIIGNSFNLKPKASFADTNLKIITNKRVYWFDIVMSTQKLPVAWHLSFRYPPEPPSVEPKPTIDPAIVAAQAVAQEKIDIEEKLGGAKKTPVSYVPREPKLLNGDYSLIGADELTPTSVFDNGELTAITFAPNKPVPAIFVKELDGSEARVNFNYENDMMIVHRVARQFVLRRGSQSACLINGNFRPTGNSGTTHTISDEVRREVKGAN
jgi:type IV secretion system protein VirB9